MAMVRYASPVGVKIVNEKRWDKIRVASTYPVLSESLSKQAERVLARKFDIDDYLLTHCSIMSSVDTYGPGSKKLGSIIEDGSRINRKYPDFRIKPECDSFINDNNDAWSRKVLIKSYPTFVGSNNYLEHVQVQEQSKGKVIDAVARDIGISVYVDLLIATHRDHESLINRIISGELRQLSMGCIIEESTCTKCGNVAVDESNMCPCVKYEKGNYFYDELGNKVRVSELCGHESINETAGVVFNDASWVKVPAFKGAMLRNILQPQEINESTLGEAKVIMLSPPKKWTSDEMSGYIKAASLLKEAASQENLIQEPDTDTESDTESDIEPESDTGTDPETDPETELEPNTTDNAESEDTEESSDAGSEEDSDVDYMEDEYAKFDEELDNEDSVDPEDPSTDNPDVGEDTGDSSEQDIGEDTGGNDSENFDDFGMDSDTETDPEPEEQKFEVPPLGLKETFESASKSVIEKLKTELSDQVKKEMEDLVLTPVQEPSEPAQPSATMNNDNLAHTASLESSLAGLHQGMIRKAASETRRRDVFVTKLRDIDRSFEMGVDDTIYKTAYKLGSTGDYGSPEDYYYKCAEILGRDPTKSEIGSMLRVSKLIKLIATPSRKSSQKNKTDH